MLKKQGFVAKNLIFIILISFLSVAGGSNKGFLYATVVTIVLAIFSSSDEHRFCWALFLVPNIRLFDDIGTTSVVNVLFILPLIFYFFKGKSNLKSFPIIGAILLFMMEILHTFINDDSVFKLIGWVLAFVCCVYATLDERINIDKDDAAYALVLGVFFSGIVYLFNNPNMAIGLLANVLKGHRFTGYASDPNAFSTYICLAFSALLIKNKIKISDYFMMLFLILFGLLTTSKMCIILIVINVSFFVIVSLNNKGKFFRGFVIIIVSCFVIYQLRGFLVQFVEEFFERLGGNNVTLDSLTSNRFTIVTDYLSVLGRDIITLFFGRGFSYYEVLETSRMQQAHNTYLDLIISWGIAGIIVFYYIINTWYKEFKNKEDVCKFSRANMLPMLNLLLSFLSLSLFDAGMFYFVIAYCFIQLKNDKTNKK